MRLFYRPFYWPWGAFELEWLENQSSIRPAGWDVSWRDVDMRWLINGYAYGLTKVVAWDWLLFFETHT